MKMPSGLFSRSNLIVHDTLPGRQAGRQAAFSLFPEHTKTLVYILLLGSFWSHLVFTCQSSYVVFFSAKTSLFLIISLYVSAYDFFSFFREEQQQVFAPYCNSFNNFSRVQQMCNWGQPTRPKCTRVFSRVTLHKKKTATE